MALRTLLQFLAFGILLFNQNVLFAAPSPGDLDGDGVRDVIVRAPESGANAISGSVLIYSGGNASLIGEIQAPVNHGLFGFEAIAVGDLNDDEISEIAISAPALVLDIDRLGAVFLYDGLTLELIAVATPEPGEMLLWEIAGTVDLDADGMGDLVVRSLKIRADRIVRDGWVVFSGSSGNRLDQGVDPDYHWPFLARPAELFSVPTPNKDLNGDKIINYLDAVVAAQLLGSQVSPASTGDVVIDGRIDAADFSAIVAALGQPSNPLDVFVDEPSPFVHPDSLPSWAERASNLICRLVCRNGYICDELFQEPIPTFRNATSGPGVWLWCLGTIDPPGCQGAVATVVYDRTVHSIAQHQMVSNIRMFEWDVVLGESRLQSWSTDGPVASGHVFTYAPILGTNARLIVHARYFNGCGYGMRILDVNMVPCSSASSVRMESPRWSMGANEHLTISAVLAPELVGPPVWEILSGHAFLQNHQVVSDELILHSGASTGVVVVRLTSADSGPCARDVRLIFIQSAAGEDTDGDGVSDLCENALGSDPLDPNSTPTAAAIHDTDNDGLTDLEECELGTDWTYYDTDGDGLPDGFEVDNGTDPNNPDTDGDGVSDADEDSDGDGMSNHDELIFGTDPNNPDSDGDGVSDGDEVNQGSDPNDPTDGGLPPPSNHVIDLRLTIGDHSASHSERWAMTVGPISLRAPGHGQVTERVFKFRRGRIYPVTIQHLGSVLSPPDYDYTASIELAGDGCISIRHAAGILGNFGDLIGPPPGEAQLFIPLIDVDIDSDNDDGHGTPSGSDSEDEIEDREDLPGKVFLASTLDADRDGVPDFADGFDLLSQLPRDDTAAEGRLVPVIVSAGGFDGDVDQILITYDASAPLAVSVTLADSYVPAAGAFRLWRIPPGLPRDGLAVLDGGDFIAPGLYNPADLGLDTSVPVTWYLESVRESTVPASGSLELTIVPGAVPYQCAGPEPRLLDRVRFTSTRVELLARGLGEEDFFEVGGLIATTLDDPTVPDYQPLPPGMTAGSWLTYVLRVHDPRPGITQVTIDGQHLPLVPAGDGGYETTEFVCLPAIFPHGANLPPYPAVTPDPGDVTWEYNPSWEFVAKPKLKEQPEYMRELHQEVDRAVAELETSNWNGLTSIDGTTYAPNDDGAFGKEVHKRVSRGLTESGWMTDVWVLRSENRIVGVGGTQPSGYASTQLTQVDIIRLKEGYRPQIGDALDPSRIDDVIEIKTSLSTSLTQGQLERLQDVVDGRDIRKGVPVRRWTRVRGWHDHQRGINIRKTFRFVGGAAVAGLTSAYTIFHYAEHEQQFVSEIEPLIDNFRREQDHAFRAQYAAEIIDKMGSYLGRFMVDDTVIDLLKLATIYRILGED